MPPPKIFTTSDWGAKSVTAPFPRRAAEGIVVHHTVNPNRPPESGDPEKQKAFKLAQAIQKDHMNRNPPFADSGQHFTISRGGVIMEGRHGSLAAAQEGFVIRAAHCGDDKHNRRFFGIENEGNFEAANDIADVQMEALVELCAWLAFWGDFDSQNIKGHKQIPRPTECPGKFMVAKLATLRTAVHNRKVQIIEEMRDE